MKIIKSLFLCLVLFFTVNSYADLVFVANVDGNWDLFSVDENGSNLARLTATPFDEKDPSWSSDRKKVVYATSDGHLNILDINTKESRQIALDEQETAQFSPSSSPKGKRIAYVQFKQGNRDDTDLIVFNLDTGKSKRVLDQPGAQFWPSWSPDGRRLIYTSVHCLTDCGRIIQELWIADTQGNYARQLLMTNSLSQQPDWSPDGNQIAFSSDKSGNFDIWLLSLKDWKLEQVTIDENLDVSPAWSPDGTKIAFISTRSGKMEIWIKNLKNGN